MDLVARALELTEGSGIGGAWHEACAAARAGELARTVKAWERMREEARFAAMIALGVIFPAARRELAIAYDAAFAREAQQGLCAVELVVGWAAGFELADLQLVHRLLRHHSACEHVVASLVRERLDRGLVEHARALAALLSATDKLAALAAIAARTGDTSAFDAALADLDQLRDAEWRARGLAEVLRDLGGRAAGDPTVERVVALMAATTIDFWLDIAARDAAKAGWPAHALRLAHRIAGDELRAARIAHGGVDPVVASVVPRSASTALHEATAAVYADVAAGRPDAAVAAMSLGFAALGPRAPVEPVERVAWARALATGGERAEAFRVIAELVRARTIPREGWVLAVEALADHADELIAVALDSGAIELSVSELEGTPFERDDLHAAAFLGRVALHTGDPSRGEALVAAARTLEDREGGWRDRRIAALVRELSMTVTPDEAGGWLDRWQQVLAADRPLLAAAVVPLATRPLDEICARVGTIPERVGVWLAVALAEAGRCGDALAVLASAGRLDVSPIELVARACRDREERALAVAAFEACCARELSEECEATAQVTRAMLLALDDADAGIVALTELEPQIATRWWRSFAIVEISRQLERTGWTANRARALLGHAGAVDPEALVAIVDGARRAGLAGEALLRAPSAVTSFVVDVEGAPEGTMLAALRETGCASAVVALAARWIHARPEAERQAAWGAVLALAAPSIPRLIDLFRVIDASDAVPLAGALAELADSDFVSAARDRLGDLVAARGATPTGLLLASSDPSTIARRIRQAACWLARHGRRAEARELATLGGL